MKVEVAKLKHNPFRNLDRLPLKEDKVAALMTSIEDTSFWDNLIGRKADDGVEIAYGHHRVEALRRLGVKTIDIQVRDLTDTEMVKIMSHENMGEWAHDAEFETETVRATLEAAADGRVDLGPCGKQKSRTFICARAQIKFTVEQLAGFLGWKEYKVRAAVESIEAATSKLVDPADLEGLSTRQSQVVVQQTKRAAKISTPEKAREVAKTLSGGMRKGSGGRYQKKEDSKAPTVTIHNAKQITDTMLAIPPKKPSKKATPDYGTFADQMAHAIRDVWGPKAVERMDAIVQYQEHLPEKLRVKLLDALQYEIEQAQRYIAALTQNPVTSTGATPRLGHQESNNG